MTTTDLDTIPVAALPSAADWGHEASLVEEETAGLPDGVPASTSRPPSGRLVGIDIARALALVGMFTQHVSIGNDEGDFSTGWVSWVFRESAGRASVLFFVLSGVSLSIIHTRGSASSSDGALWRRGVLLLTGGLLLTSVIWPASILQHYGLAFLLAPWLLRLGQRGLITVTGLGLLGGPVFLLFARNWSGEVTGAWSGQTGSWLISTTWDILVSGIYPMVLWMGFFTLGMVIGRIDLYSKRTLVRMMIAAAIATVALGTLSAELTDRYGDVTAGAEFDEASAVDSDADIWDDDDLWKELRDGSFKFLGDESKLDEAGDIGSSKFDDFVDVDRPANWRELYDVTGHSGHIGWTMQTGALTLAIMSAALLLPHTVTSALSPLAWMGSMSLTAYLVHIVLVGDVFDRFIAEADWSIVEKEWALLGLIGVMVLACSAFHLLLSVGPFEWLLKKFTVTPHP